MKRALLFVLVAACNDPIEPATPRSTPTPSTANTVVETPPPEEPPAHRKPFPVRNTCGEVVTLVFAEDPKAAGALTKTVAPSSEIEGLREPDGTVWVWLLDTKGEPIIKVHVTRGMKKVEVGRSCRTLDAR